MSSLLPPQEDTAIMLPSLSTKHLVLCFDEANIKENRITYLLKSVPVLKLFNSSGSSELSQSVFQQVRSWEELSARSNFPFGIGLLPSKDNHLYAVFHGSGTSSDKTLSVPKRTLTMCKYSVSHAQSTIKLGHLPPISFMNSRFRHHMPILVEINKCIYVFSQGYKPPTMADTIPLYVYDFRTSEFQLTLPHQPFDPPLDNTNNSLDDRCIVFQVYDPRKDQWTTLPVPPFVDPNSHLPCHYPWSVLAVRNKIYVSTPYVSAAFCTDTRKWENCELFSLLLAGQEIWSDNRMLNNYLRKSSYCGFGDPKKGLGFPFLAESDEFVVVCDDFLLTTPPGDMVYYKVSSDRIIRPGNTLWPSGFDKLEGISDCLLADLGDGYVCLMGLVFSSWDAIRPCKLKFFLFKVSKSLDGETLSCTAAEDVLVSTVDMNQENEDEENPASCFVRSFFAFTFSEQEN